MTLRKLITAALAVTMMMTTVLTGCGKGGNELSADSAITVIAREEGSGTRSAFVELLGVVDEDGRDIIVATAENTSSTSVVITSVKDNVTAMGYISLGALSDDVKAVKVDGVAATAENVKNGTYKVSRPFNVAYKADSISQVAKDFLTFIMSVEGQAIITEEGYISVDTTENYTAAKLSGKVVLAGSTSVSPVMEVLAEKYMELNPDVTIEIQQSGSSAGMTSAIEDACDIGMASREVKDSELEKGLTSLTIATDGIAVIVNNNNTLADELTSEQIKQIYLGEVTKWSLSE